MLREIHPLMVIRMVEAASPFLNRPLRSAHEAQTARDQAERERQRRLERHGAAFCRRILDGAFERVDQPDGGYRLRDLATGRWINDETSPCGAANDKAATSLAAAPNLMALMRTTAATPITAPDATRAACRLGYHAALRDVAHWIAAATIEPHLHADTVAALNAQIAVLAHHAVQAIERNGELG